jgi:hypothetical protein
MMLPLHTSSKDTRVDAGPADVTDGSTVTTAVGCRRDDTAPSITDGCQDVALQPGIRAPHPLQIPTGC